MDEDDEILDEMNKKNNVQKKYYIDIDVADMKSFNKIMEMPDSYEEQLDAKYNAIVKWNQDNLDKEFDVERMIYYIRPNNKKFGNFSQYYFAATQKLKVMEEAVKIFYKNNHAGYEIEEHSHDKAYFGIFDGLIEENKITEAENYFILLSQKVISSLDYAPTINNFIDIIVKKNQLQKNDIHFYAALTLILSVKEEVFEQLSSGAVSSLFKEYFDSHPHGCCAIWEAIKHQSTPKILEQIPQRINTLFENGNLTANECLCVLMHFNAEQSVIEKVLEKSEFQKICQKNGKNDLNNTNTGIDIDADNITTNHTYNINEKLPETSFEKIKNFFKISFSKQNIQQSTKTKETKIEKKEKEKEKIKFDPKYFLYNEAFMASNFDMVKLLLKNNIPVSNSQKLINLENGIHDAIKYEIKSPFYYIFNKVYRMNDFSDFDRKMPIESAFKILDLLQENKIDFLESENDGKNIIIDVILNNNYSQEERTQIIDKIFECSQKEAILRGIKNINVYFDIHKNDTAMTIKQKKNLMIILEKAQLLASTSEIKTNKQKILL